MPNDLNATYMNSSLPVSERVEDLLGRMTLAEKIGQMTQPEKNSISPEQVQQYAIGSVLSGGGGNPSPNTPESWAAMVKGFITASLQTRLGIPLIYGVDAVHGHNNLKGATIFPHNIGLGAAGDADLVRRIARATALEVCATGVRWNFAPALSVPQDIRWGRTYEGYSEDPALVSELGAAYVRGLQNVDDSDRTDHPHSVMASIKHFVGDGATAWGSTGTYDWINFVWQSDDDRWSIDQGDARIDEATLRDIHLFPYHASIAAGALNAMVSYSSWNGVKMHAHSYLLTDVLRGEMGFEGFLVSDWMALNQIDADYYTAVVKSINAGLDMIMVPFDFLAFIETMTRAVEAGDIPLARVDDAVRRILTSKFRLGLVETPLSDEALLAHVGSAAHRDLAREAVRKSLVLLKNEAALPLPREARLLVAGQAAHNIGMQCGGWTIEWMGGEGATTEGTTLLEGLRGVVTDAGQVVYAADAEFEADTRAPYGLAVVGEMPYAEGVGDRENLALRPEDVALIKKLRPLCDRLILLVISGRPQIITEVEPLCDAIVAAWLPGTEADGIAQVLVGDYAFTGRLSYNWPRSMEQVPLSALNAHAEPPLWPRGFGLSL